MISRNVGRPRGLRIAVVTSIHPDFDARVWRHAKLLSGLGQSVYLICPWKVQRGKDETGIVFMPFSPIKKRMFRPLLVPTRVLARLLPILRCVDIVHFHDIDMLPFMLLISFMKPVVYDVHELYPKQVLVKEWLPKPIRRPLAWAVRNGQCVISRVIRNIVLVSPSQRNDFSARGMNVSYIYNYASRDLMESVKKDYFERRPAVVFIGSQYIENGSMLFLDIAARVLKINSRIRFVAVDRFGSKEFRAKYVQEIKRLGLEGSIELRPNVMPPAIMELLNEATIAVSPNLRVEAQIGAIPTKVFEYMAAGLPMVLSDLPHQVGVVEASGGGLLAAPERPEEFAEAILKLAGDRGAAEEMGRRGQKAFLEKYCYESQSGEMLGFYRRVLGETT